MPQRSIHIITTSIRLLSILVIVLGVAATLYSGAHAQQSSPQQSGQEQHRGETLQKEATPSKPQSPPALKSSKTPSEAQSSAGQEIEEGEVIRVNTNLVNLHVRVVDRSNRPVNDVRQDEFRVYEDGVLQTIEFLTKEEVPISYGLAVDNSGSMRSQIEKVMEAAKTIIANNKPGDETLRMIFVESDKIETLQDFTSNKEAIIEAFDNMYIEGGQTAVVDAVYLSTERISQYRKGNNLSYRRRRALILVTDGEDRASYYKQDQLFEHLREADVQIFVIGFVNELEKEGGFIRKSPRQRAINLLNKLAKETGGRAFYPESLSELPEIAKEIARDMRTQYVIGYNPTNKARDGSYRQVRVTVADAPGRNKRIAITRSGYTAPREGSPTNRPTATYTQKPQANGHNKP